MSHREKKLGEALPAELLGMFREVKTPVICVVEDDGEPHASAMNWWYEDDKGRFFMNPAEGTRKYGLMREGGRADWQRGAAATSCC